MGDLLKAEESQKTLANAAELASNIILSVVGNDVSDSLNGEVVGRQLLTGVSQARFARELKLI